MWPLYSIKDSSSWKQRQLICKIVILLKIYICIIVKFKPILIFTHQYDEISFTHAFIGKVSSGFYVGNQNSHIIYRRICMNYRASSVHHDPEKSLKRLHLFSVY
jgi:hypothetical protein